MGVISALRRGLTRTALWAAVAAWVLPVLGGCQKTQYLVGGESFTSSQAALDRMDAIIADQLAPIKPTKTPVHGTAIVVEPSPERVQQTGIRITGDPARVSKEQIDYVTQTQGKNIHAMYTAIEKRKMFDSVTRVLSGDPEKVPLENCDFLVYFYQPSPDIAQWYLRTKSSPDRRPIYMDTGKPIGTSRTLSWLDNLEGLCRSPAGGQAPAGAAP